MALPIITGEFGVISLDLKFSQKGNAWLKIRGVAKDRVRDASGQWADGDPLFIDIIVNQGSEHLCESVVKGDTVARVLPLWHDELAPQVRAGKRLLVAAHGNSMRALVKYLAGISDADSVGVSTRWAPARTQRSIDSNDVPAAAKALGAEVIEQTEAPF